MSANLSPFQLIASQELPHLFAQVDSDQVTILRNAAGKLVNEMDRSDASGELPEVGKKPSMVQELAADSSARYLYLTVFMLLPDYLVLPDVALSAIFDYGKMSAALNNQVDVFQFLRLKTDLCIFNRQTLRPLLAIDGYCKDRKVAQSAHEILLKEKIFALGGLPLIGHYFEEPYKDFDPVTLMGRLTREIIRAVHQC